MCFSVQYAAMMSPEVMPIVFWLERKTSLPCLRQLLTVQLYSILQ